MYNIMVFLKYFSGVLVWYIVIGFLQYNCILNVSFLIDDVFNKKINHDFSINTIGEISFRLTGDKCSNKYIYTVKYHPTDLDRAGEVVALGSILDIPTWVKIESDTTRDVYVDSKHKYYLYNTSDGIYMRATDKL